MPQSLDGRIHPRGPSRARRRLHPPRGHHDPATRPHSRAGVTSPSTVAGTTDLLGVTSARWKPLREPVKSLPGNTIFLPTPGGGTVAPPSAEKWPGRVAPWVDGTMRRPLESGFNPCVRRTPPQPPAPRCGVRARGEPRGGEKGPRLRPGRAPRSYGSCACGGAQRPLLGPPHPTLCALVRATKGFGSFQTPVPGSGACMWGFSRLPRSENALAGRRLSRGRINTFPQVVLQEPSRNGQAVDNWLLVAVGGRRLPHSRQPPSGSAFYGKLRGGLCMECHPCVL